MRIKRQAFNSRKYYESASTSKGIIHPKGLRRCIHNDSAWDDAADYFASWLYRKRMDALYCDRRFNAWISDVRIGTKLVYELD